MIGKLLTNSKGTNYYIAPEIKLYEFEPENVFLSGSNLENPEKGEDYGWE